MHPECSNGLWQNAKQHTWEWRPLPKAGVQPPPPHTQRRGSRSPRLWQQEAEPVKEPEAPYSCKPCCASPGKCYIVLPSKQECLRVQPSMQSRPEGLGLEPRAISGRLAHSAGPSEPCVSSMGAHPATPIPRCHTLTTTCV